MKKTPAKKRGGKLRIGDHWNAITIIALSQTNPLKAIAEFVENSIDAKAKNVTIIRGKQKGEYYLKIIDDGEGISDFQYMGTHIGDSIKRKLKEKGATGIQGEFGIGLLSFWTVGETLSITSTGREGLTQRMLLVKGDPAFSIRDAATLFPQTGTELHIRPILAGVRQLSGEKIQNYLASELRDRIAKSGVRIRIADRTSRRELIVEPRKFHGRLLHGLPEIASPLGEVYAELYISQRSAENQVGLYKNGTRIIPDLTTIDRFRQFPWTSGYLEGIVDASFLQLTPGTRDGIIYDEAFASLSAGMEKLEEHLAELIREQEKAEEEEASKAILHRVTRALREAFLLLPQEDYGWLNIQAQRKSRASGDGSAGDGPAGKGAAGIDGGTGDGSLPDGEAPDEDGAAPAAAVAEQADPPGTQKEFFQYPGPLHSFLISPATAFVGVGEKRRFRGISRDKSRRTVDSGLSYSWAITQGAGSLDMTDGEFAEYTAPEEPGLTILEAEVRQGEETRRAQAVVTVTAELIPQRERESSGRKKGIPGYTYRSAPGELWRSRYEEENSLIIINNAHPDFIFASRQGMTKLRYIVRLFAKELVLANFPEAGKEELLERMVELTLYAEENLR